MTYEILIKDLPAQPALVIRRAVSMDSQPVGAAFAEIFPRIASYLERIGAVPGGAPFARFDGAGAGSFDIAGGIPVAEAIPGDGEIVATELPAGAAAVTWHIGPYEGLMDAHQAMEAWLGESGHRSNGPCWEVYWTNPSEEPDPEKWQTELVWPIV